jgi:hypothetical protein
MCLLTSWQGPHQLLPDVWVHLELWWMTRYLVKLFLKRHCFYTFCLINKSLYLILIALILVGSRNESAKKNDAKLPAHLDKRIVLRCVKRQITNDYNRVAATLFESALKTSYHRNIPIYIPIDSTLIGYDVSPTIDLLVTDALILEFLLNKKKKQE